MSGRFFAAHKKGGIFFSCGRRQKIRSAALISRTRTPRIEVPTCGENVERNFLLLWSEEEEEEGAVCMGVFRPSSIPDVFGQVSTPLRPAGRKSAASLAVVS